MTLLTFLNFGVLGCHNMFVAKTVKIFFNIHTDFKMLDHSCNKCNLIGPWTAGTLNLMHRILVNPHDSLIFQPFKMQYTLLLYYGVNLCNFFLLVSIIYVI